jgi:hypothetical protein
LFRMTSSAVVAQYSRSTFPPGCWMMTPPASAWPAAHAHKRW